MRGMGGCRWYQMLPNVLCVDTDSLTMCNGESKAWHVGVGVPAQPHVRRAAQRGVCVQPRAPLVAPAALLPSFFLHHQR
jgi:hypothetical protein